MICSATCSAGRPRRSAGAAARAARPARSAARTSRPSCISTSTRRCTASPRRVASRPTRVCSVCHGSGAEPGTTPGRVPAVRRQRRRSLVDQGPFSFSQVCPTCGGRGTDHQGPVPARAAGRGVEVRAARREGADPGRRRRRPAHPRARAGARPGANGGPPGDLYVVVTSTPHPIFGEGQATSRCRCRSRSRKPRSGRR